MRFFPDNIWSLTTVIASMLVASSNISIAIAGGDPNVKDKKIEKSDSNIKQHNHKKVYETTNKVNNKNKSEKKDANFQSNNTDKDGEVETAGFAAVEDEPLIID